MSIRLKLTLWYSSLLAVTLLIFGMSIYWFVNYNTYRDIKGQIEAELSHLRIVPNLFQGFKSESERTIDGSVYVQVVNYATGRIEQSPNLQYTRLKLPYPRPEEVRDGYVDMKIGNYNFLAYQESIKVNDTVIGLKQVAYYTSPHEIYMKNMRTILLFASLGVLVIAFTIGMFIARQALRPLKYVVEAANQIKNGSNLSIRIEREGPNDEMGHLTDTLNGMLERLETTYNELDEAYKAQRRFVSDASHELRTPLTTIRGNIELLDRMWKPLLHGGSSNQQVHDSDKHGDNISLSSSSSITGNRAEPDALGEEKIKLTREAMLDIADEAKRMTGLVNDLLALARADAGYVMEKTPQLLLPLVEDVARRAQLLPRTAEWRIGDLSPLEGVMIEAHADFIRQLIFIFVENAFKYTPEGTVEIKAVRSSDQAGIMIRDTGIGMNNEEIPHIFERFYRADVSRGKTAGTGLGLSIAKWIIDEHGGSVEVSTREEVGTTFIVWLPIALLQEPDQV